jgi:hypothetical protein
VHFISIHKIPSPPSLVFWHYQATISLQARMGPPQAVAVLPAHQSHHFRVGPNGVTAVAESVCAHLHMGFLVA